MNIKLDLKEKLLQHTGEEYADGATLGKSLGALLATETSKDESKIHKLPAWARDCHVEQELTVDEADLKFIKDTIISSDRYLPIVKAQLLKVIDDAKQKAVENSLKKVDKK